MTANKNIISEMTGAVLNDETIDEYVDTKNVGKTEDKILKERLTSYVDYLHKVVYPTLLKKSFSRYEMYKG